MHTELKSQLQHVLYLHTTFQFPKHYTVLWQRKLYLRSKTLQKAIAIVSFPFHHLVSNPSKVINVFGDKKTTFSFLELPKQESKQLQQGQTLLKVVQKQRRCYLNGRGSLRDPCLQIPRWQVPVAVQILYNSNYSSVKDHLFYLINIFGGF